MSGRGNVVAVNISRRSGRRRGVMSVWYGDAGFCFRRSSTAEVEGREVPLAAGCKTRATVEALVAGRTPDLLTRGIRPLAIAIVPCSC
jgi:hypothetical protein